MSARSNHSTTRTLAVLAMLVVPSVTFAQTDPHVRSDLWVTDGVVNAMTFSGNTVYIGGTFTQVGPPVGHVAAIDRSSGNALGPYLRVDGNVGSFAQDGSGGWFLSGHFQHVRGQPRLNLARIDANGNVTPWNPSPQGGDVFSLLVANGILYVGGEFNVIGGAPRSGAAAFDIATGALTPWNPSPNDDVSRIVAGDGRIYLSGAFTQVGGQPRNQIAAVDPLTGACLPWTTPVTFGGVLTSWGGTLYVTAFTSLELVSESTGESLVSIPTIGNVITAVADPANETVYLGGGFTGLAGNSRSRLAAIDEVGNLMPWNPGANHDVLDLEIDSASGTVIAAGSFTVIGGQPRPYLASIGSQNGVVTAWSPRPNMPVLDVHVGGDVVYAGGAFWTMNTVPRLNAAAIDASSGTALPWNPSPNGEVHCMTAGDGAVYLGGAFGSAGGAGRIHFAKVDEVTGVASAWTANMNPGDFNVPFTMSLLGNTLFTGGSFQSIAGVTRRFLAAIDATTGTILPWNPDPNSVVRTMQVQPGVDVTQPSLVYVGGEFTSIGGTGRNYLAAINLSTGAVSGWNPNPNGFVHCLAIKRDFSGFPQAIYFGGNFTLVNGIPRGRAAATSVSGDLFPWDPIANGTVLSIVPTGWGAYLGGYFTRLRGDPLIKYFGAVDELLGDLTNWIPQVDSEGSLIDRVNCILKLRDTIYVGGYFASVQGFPNVFFAGLVDPTVTWVENGATPPPPSPLRTAPNPFHAFTVARFALPRAGGANVAVYDVAGRRVRQLHRGPLPAGSHAWSWDGTDDRGRSAPGGVYFLRVSAAGVELSSKLQLLR